VRDDTENFTCGFRLDRVDGFDDASLVGPSFGARLPFLRIN
jgi:hypothetical protein